MSKIGFPKFYLRNALCAQSCLTLCGPMDCALQAPLFMGFSRQEYWSGLPFAPPGDLPESGIESTPPALQVDPVPLSHKGNNSSQIIKFYVEISQIWK